MGLIDKLKEWMFKSRFKPVTHFISDTGIIELNFPEGWLYRFDEYCYDFISSNINGAIQISAYVNQQEDCEIFNINTELNEIQKRIDEPSIVQLEKHTAIHYSTKEDHEKLINHHWHTGYDNVMVYVTFNHHSLQTEDELNEEYKLVNEIIQGIKINPQKK